MGGSRGGQRWFRLPWYQNHGDRSPADVCAEYKNSPDLMTVARFQKCVPLCVYELWKLSDWGRGAPARTPPSQFVSWVRAFTDQAVWSGSIGTAVCSRASLLSPWAALAYWPRQLCLPPQQPRCRRISIQFISELEERKKKRGKKSFSSGNKNMSTSIHVKNRLYPCPWWVCVFVRQRACFCPCVLALA